MATKYVGAHTVPLEDEHGKRQATLLWGDPCHLVGDGGAGAVRVRARNREGFVAVSALTTKRLLEIYVIDVGQGDGILLRTPDGKWHLVDAGVANVDQMTKKGTANFLRWKFLRDLRKRKVSLETVIVSHPDYDHFGGLLNVLSGDPGDGGLFPVEVKRLYHSGIGRFAGKPLIGRAEPGEVAPFPFPDQAPRRTGRFVTELLEGKESFAQPTRAFGQKFGKYAELVATVPEQVARLSRDDGHLPGYGPGEPVEVRVLGPVVESIGGGRKGLRRLGSDGETLNGHSIVLRLDYGDARILLTGDLNEPSQRLLLSYVAAQEFASDVAKACHHGAEDVHLDFIRALAARATVISSGDNEDYSHPRPVLMGASARYGREIVDDEHRVLPPLVYSTELARSVKLAHATSVRVELDGGAGGPKTETVPSRDAAIKAPGERQFFQPLEQTPLGTDLVYGLVNVRTDGTHVLCATMEEQAGDFDVKVFRAGASA
jgi:beta-lactamase superfamily II metal-dependent hydrolase